MKKIWIILFFASLVSSCSSRSELKGSRVLVQFRDTIPHQYYLLSVRDSSLLVEPGHFDALGPSMVIPFSRIKQVMHDVGGKANGILFGGLIGAAAAIGGTLAVGASQGGNTGGGEGVAFTGVIVSIPAMIIGMIIGYNVSTDEKGFDVYNAHDRDVLREYSQYPDHEPPELQKIK